MDRTALDGPMFTAAHNAVSHSNTAAAPQQYRIGAVLVGMERWMRLGILEGLGQGVLRQHMTRFQLVPNDNKVVRGGRVCRSERVVGAILGRISGRPRTCFARTGAAATVGIVKVCHGKP